MFSPEIWNAFQTEYVMVFQCDSIFAPDAASRLQLHENENEKKRDYYGAVAGELSTDKFIINGGLSYRRTAAFAKAVLRLEPEDRQLPEDVAFCRVMRRHPTEFTLPSVEECMHFAIESFGDPSTAIGMHGTDKQYCPPALITAMLGTCDGKHTQTIADCFTYDGEPIALARIKLLDSIVDRFVIVEAMHTHSGQPKTLQYDRSNFEKYAHKICYLVIDAFPPMPEGFGDDMPWVQECAKESWWAEKYQRDHIMLGLDGMPSNTLVHVSDVDEIPDPSVLATLKLQNEFPVHLSMAFLVHTPMWLKREEWTRAFVASKAFLTGKSLTSIRCNPPHAIQRNGGWHCTSFFSVERQIQKVLSFAHREHAAETDPELIRRRFEEGKDPYGRGAAFDCDKTMEHAWLQWIL